ncbi:MAG: hypothetical protein ACLGIN_00530, partial [Candidatus Sericytochromatia bacterium]
MSHYLILLLPLLFMPLSSMAMRQYSQQFGVPRFPFSNKRLAAAMACYVSLGLMLVFYDAPGIHATWTFATLLLWGASFEGNLQMVGQPEAMKPYWWPYLAVSLAISLWAGLTFPHVPSLLAWGAIGVGMQVASIMLLGRGAPSPAKQMMIAGYVFGIAPVLVAPWVLVHAPLPWALDLCMVSVVLSAMLIAMGGMNLVLEGTAHQLQTTRDRIAAEVEERTAELRVANHQLQEISRQKDHFLSRVSHELRTPL